MKPEELTNIKEGIVMDQMLPYLKVEIDRMQASVDNRVYGELLKGTLTPEKALLAWQEKAAARKLLSKFDRTILEAQAVAEVKAPELDKLGLTAHLKHYNAVKG